MFDRDKFSYLLIKARGERNNAEFSRESGVSRAYISGYINKNIDKPPTPEIIRRLAEAAYNDVTYEDLMEAAGYIEKSESTNPDMPQLTPKEEKDIAKRLEQLRKELEKQQGLMFNGEPASPEAIESILAALEFGMRQAKIINKKYTPKKYRKDK
ncbi:MAG: helix-turn-helix domain-containing protein [Caloramator sp.]|nr:helix-turn-helix domain-containing protein [Caloramator sp.]